MTIIERVVEELNTLSLAEQQKVLEYVYLLKKEPLKGVPGKSLLQFAGTIPPEDLEIMKQAIEEEFGYKSRKVHIDIC